MRVGAHNCRAGLVGLALVAALAFGVPAARADGDPASDVLVTQSLFLPQDAGVTPARQSQLQTLLHDAARSGYPIRVAVIATRTDLGSVTELWNQPQNYARFLAAELGLVYRGPLLVAMPHGYGLVRAAKSALPPPAGDPTSAAIAAVRRLAAAAGHPLPAIGAGVAPAARGGIDITAWIVFAAGWIVVLSAWAASLRARPLTVSKP